MFGSWIRRAGFWTLDIMRGGSRCRAYQDILLGDTNQSEKLIQILNYSKEHVPFYKNINSNDISAFPVMSKAKYRQMKEDEYRSDEFKGQKLRDVYTSGSTGTPFHVVHDSWKRARLNCDLIHCHDKIGWKLGDHYVFVRNWVSNYKQSRLKNIFQNVYNVNIVEMDDECKKKLFKHLQKHKKSVLFGYASAIYELALYIEQNKVDGAKLEVKLVVTDSDALTPQMRKCINNAFHCYVVNRYDNEESGLLGVSEPNGDRLYLNTASMYFEILKLNSDKACEPGEVGRVVVTDLYNKAMPLIRYDTGDLAVSFDKNKIKTIETLHGRASGCLSNTKGRLVSDVSISGATEPFVGIVKYQIIQNKKRYIFKYVGALDNVSEKQLKGRFVKAFGEDATIVFEKVEDIAVGKNGKYSTTINLT